jgi:2-polyprenyl-3-methyl-5-hydroxy-6-metoxy-1,4-benzoquinol methylase
MSRGTNEVLETNFAKGAFVNPDTVQEAVEIGGISSPNCFLCGDKGTELYADLVDWLFGVPGNWTVRHCSACAVAWPDPQPRAEDIPKLYSSYHTHGAAPKTRFDGLRRGIRQCVLARMGYPAAQAQEILPRLLSRVIPLARAAALDVMNLAPSTTGTLLDVGCGNGEFLGRMRDLGWSVCGVDPDPAAARKGRSEGLQIFVGTISDVPDTTRYDVITMNHVIEHVSDPVGLLRECRKRLRPRTGTLVITTPNIKSLGHWWFKRYWRGLEVPRHLVLFSPESLSDCVNRSGLRLGAIRTETRLARMICNPSISANGGNRHVGEQINFKVSTKCFSYGFQLLEDVMVGFKKNLGEEIYCECLAPAGDDDKQE